LAKSPIPNPGWNPGDDRRNTYPVAIQISGHRLSLASGASFAVSRENILMSTSIHSDQSILTITGSSVTCAAGVMIARLVGKTHYILEPSNYSKTLAAVHRCTLLLDCITDQDQVPALVEMRLHGFRGAVLILSVAPFDAIKARYRVLRCGHGSHATCVSPFSLPEIIAKITALVPLEPENLTMLQAEIKAPQRFLKSCILPSVRRIRNKKADLKKELASLTEAFELLRAQTPVACHVVVTINGQQAQIQEHMQRIFDTLRNSPSSLGEPLDNLEHLLREWQRIVMFRTSEPIDLESQRVR
jgi:hypothetical protein